MGSCRHVDAAVRALLRQAASAHRGSWGPAFASPPTRLPPQPARSDLYPDPDGVSCYAHFNGTRKLPNYVERDGKWHHLAATWTREGNGLTQVGWLLCLAPGRLRGWGRAGTRVQQAELGNAPLACAEERRRLPISLFGLPVCCGRCAPLCACPAPTPS